jgi:pimeloyl-ACP methyl ester carboxylesterase
MDDSGTRVALTTEDGRRLDARWHEGGDRAVVLAHGITVDLDENGMFPPLAAGLVARGLSVLRFTFRGHGDSDGAARDMTIAGERLDLRAAVEWAGRPVAVLGSSFGAVSVTLSCAELPVHSVVLWQPVLDLRRTFLEPELPRGRALYGTWTGGDHDIEGRFVLGAPLRDEFAALSPADAFLAATQPALVIHGDADEHVSHDIARDTALRREHTDWHSIPGAGHGFADPAAFAKVLDTTVEWLAR